ncbi:multiple epidermal growth factor-like domains protein 6 [Ptychodera flava]|uniref:multiple epidermal growth factor-like domains protein 6 n=1 Tax=Ptychodera flava TaxID=63121 RepID=UPI00396A20DB
MPTGMLKQSLIMATLVLVIVTAKANSESHVCTRKVKRETYRSILVSSKDMYHRTCGWWGWSSCTAYKTEYHTDCRPTTELVTEQYCCPGWSNMDNECRTPICTPSCENGSTCISPNVCTCPPNFTGPTCNEGLTTNPCQHYNGGCTHTCVPCSGSSYFCDCPDGYRLSLNRRGCDVIN